MCEQAQGAKTWAGRSGAATGIHYYGKECLDIHLLKAAAHEAVAHPTRGLVPCADDTQAEWVTYPYRAAYPILRWLPSKLAECKSLPFHRNMGISGQWRSLTKFFSRTLFPQAQAVGISGRLLD